MMRNWCLGMIAGLTGLAAATPACAETASAHWDAYFYAAPRASAQVLDEVQRETSLDVQSCVDGWCRVLYGKASGFVREEVVHGPSNDVLPPGRRAGKACFTAVQPGGGAWQDERFCTSKP